MLRRFVAAPRFVASIDTCWIWRGALNDGGYGVVRVQDRVVKAHRHVYELLCGPIPPGLTLDHLCRNRACVRPSHLEPASRGDNTLRGVGPSALNSIKVLCIRGHLLPPPVRGKKRQCQACLKWLRTF